MATLLSRPPSDRPAQRLGHALHKAFDGVVHYGFSHENKFAHVTWSRDRDRVSSATAPVPADDHPEVTAAIARGVGE